MKVYNLNEITDSKILYDKKPPAFMNYIILIVLALIAAALILANKSVKTYMVKGQGLVVSENKSHIMTKTSGEIKEVFIEEGREVKEGDILFTTTSLETDLQLEQVNAQIDTYSKRIELLRLAEENATNGTNYFDRYNETESEFYNRLSQAYIARKEFDVDEKSLEDQGYEQKQIDEYVKTQKNKANEQYFKTISEFSNEKNQYEMELSKLIAQKEALEKSKEQYQVVAQKNGTVPGKVLSIDEDATIDNENGSVYFKVRVKPEKIYLEDSKGEKVNLSLGMITETRVKYEKITYMKYLLELIGVKFS